MTRKSATTSERSILGGVSLCCLLLMLLSSTVTYAELPLDVQADMYAVAAKKHYQSGDYAKAEEAFKKLMALDVELPDSTYFFYAKTLWSNKDYPNGKKYLVIYIEKTGRAGKHYRDTIGMLAEYEDFAWWQKEGIEEKPEYTELVWQVKQNDLDAVRLMLESRSVNVNALSRYTYNNGKTYTYTALCQAVGEFQNRNTNRADLLSMVQLLLEKGARPDIDCENKTSNLSNLGTAIILKDRSEAVKVTTLLLEHGADPNGLVANGGVGFTALGWAWNNPEIFRLLLAKGANPDHCYRDPSYSILDSNCLWRSVYIAVEKVYAGVDTTPIAGRVSLLLENGANPNTSDDSVTLIAFAISNYAPPEIIEALLDAGADSNMPTATNYAMGRIRPMSVAIHVAYAEAVRMLLAHGASLDYKDVCEKRDGRRCTPSKLLKQYEKPAAKGRLNPKKLPRPVYGHKSPQEAFWARHDLNEQLGSIRQMLNAH